MGKGRESLNFDDWRIGNKSTLGWVIRNSNGIIRIFIIVEYITLKDDILVVKNNEFLNLDSKIVINCYNKKKVIKK